MTARELLVSVAGETHALHSPVFKARSRQAIQITCSCGKIFAVPNTEENLHSLRNIPLVAS